MKLMDAQCEVCGEIFEDLWEEDAVKCEKCGGLLKKIFLSAPAVDACAPFRVPSLGGPAFSSKHEMKKYARETNQYVIDRKQTLRETTLEERLSKNKQQKVDAFQKAFYRLKHGYKDHPPLQKEKETNR